MACTLTLVLAAASTALVARRVEAEQVALSSGLDGLGPLVDEVAALRSQLVRTAAGAAVRRDRLAARTPSRPPDPDHDPPGGRRGRADGHR